ncbi:MAG TPA: cob(I)yrinic acid a,c-diamide adenosyltransferase [Bacteroidales bacterium]|nr:MAG: ATP:cob(I)alamin adenosyltransferase [Bacteroidetes bacterium GWF2_33_38]OFY89199.1 MAG: ATP:cob(I)alamin adenosyltransferase [Bacteroidetes bacterium RIFOXYA2_FULL_33_7]HBF87619.1 cob(I)yrinic acid a,c-diamide adenosyltransferase [Bacteroidales bacterium]
MKVYTKTGDDGTTSLIGGKRVKKNNPRLETYGTIDELNSYLGLIASYHISTAIDEFILDIQKKLMLVSSHIANEDKKIVLPDIEINDITIIENKIDELSESLPTLNSFVIPGGSQTAAFCNITRTVCRRAERNLISLNEIANVSALHIQYFNRLSDFLFVLGRYSFVSSNLKEIYWNGK